MEKQLCFYLFLFAEHKVFPFFLIILGSLKCVFFVGGEQRLRLGLGTVFKGARVVFYQECTPQARPSPDLFPRGNAALWTESLSILSVMVHRTGKPALQTLVVGLGEGNYDLLNGTFTQQCSAMLKRYNGYSKCAAVEITVWECCPSFLTDTPSYVSSVSPITAWH